MNQNQSHIVFDGEKIVVSSDLFHVLTFLSHIESEVEGILSINDKLADLSDGFSDVLKLMLDLFSRLEEFEPNIRKEKFKLENTKDLNSLLKKLEGIFSPRSHMIVLMSSLEVLLAFYVAYDYEISTKKEIIAKMTGKNNNATEFLDNFVLTDKNNYFNVNKKKLSPIKSLDLRNLRNDLVHFFSVSEKFIISYDKQPDEEYIKEKLKNVLLLSVKDLAYLVKDAHLLMISNWMNDFRKDKVIFNIKIKHVSKIVDDYAARMIEFKEK